MGRYVLCLKEEVAMRFTDFSYQMGGFSGLNKATKMFERMPVDAFEIVPLEVLMPDLETMAQAQLSKAAAEVGSKVADEVIGSLTKATGEG